MLTNIDRQLDKYGSELYTNSHLGRNWESTYNKIMNTSRLLSMLLFLSSAASAVVITLGPSTQTVTFTGTAVSASAAGTSRISWGSCVYDGKQTTCTVSGPYTGLGQGGTYSYVLVYPGNGASPLSAVSSPPGNDLIYYSLTAGTLTFTITPNGGTPVRFYDLTSQLFFNPSNDFCTGVGTCSVGAVGLSMAAQSPGVQNGTFDTTPVINVGGVVTATDYGGFKTIAPATFVEIYGLNLFDDTGPGLVQCVQWPTHQHRWEGQPPRLGARRLRGTLQSASGEPPGAIRSSARPAAGSSVHGGWIQPCDNGDCERDRAGDSGSLGFQVRRRPVPFALFPDNRTYVLPPSVVPSLPTNRAKPDDVLILYGLGFGPVSPNLTVGTLVEQSNQLFSFQAFFAGVQATVQFAGLVQTYTGLYQFNIVVPTFPPAIQRHSPSQSMAWPANSRFCCRLETSRPRF